MARLYILLLITIVCWPSQTESASLEAIQVKNPFIDPVFFSTPYYDGDSDTIYLFGGLSKILPYTMIAGFSISNESLWKAGALPLYETGSKSPVLTDPNSPYFFYFTASDFNSTNVQKFDPADGSLKQVGIIPYSTAVSSSAKSPDGKLNYIFGGQGLDKNIFQLDLTTLPNSEDEVIQLKVVGRLSQVFSTSSSVTVGNKVFIFGTPHEKFNTFPYIILNLDTLECSDPLSFHFPKFNGAPSVVKGNGDEIYIIGGYTEGTPTNGIIRMNTTSQDWEFIRVENFPVADSRLQFLIAPATVFVEKLNRLYFFGGLDGTVHGEVNFRNDIWYIDLDPFDSSSNLLE